MVMPATDSELTAMEEDPHALEDEKGTPIPSSVPPTSVPSSTPLSLTAMRHNFTNETEIESKAVSMASNDCSSALSSPAEASPAKSAVSPPTTFGGTTETSPTTSHIASASDSLICKGASTGDTEPPPSLLVLPSTTFGSPDQDADFPSVLTFKGVSVTLENNKVWKQFYSCGTEMILTKQGRRMFPYCRFRLAGLDPEKSYSLVLSIVPSDAYRYRWNASKWEVSGLALNQSQGLIRAFSHHYSPCKGSEWMSTMVSFYKVKLTNSSQDLDDHVVLQSMHRYIPRLHVIPVPEGEVPTPETPVVTGPESMTFTFLQTEFMAVTSYQNFRITQLKINHNPFAKSFREDGNNPRLNRVNMVVQPLATTDAQPSTLKPAEVNEPKEEAVDLSTKNNTVPAPLPKVQETRLVLKPIMSSTTNKNDPYVPCIRGNHALGELVLVEKRPRVEVKEETDAVRVTPRAEQGIRATPEATSVSPTSTTSPGYRKRRKRINRHWANSRGRQWNAVNASPTVVHSPSLTVAMQPELDDVEGLLFVSFASKEALEVHVRDTAAKDPSSASPVSLTTPVELSQTVEVIPETDEEKIARLEALLLQDLRALKHRQAIHPVLQEVGLKLSSLDLTKSIDLQYLGVHLPLPPPNLPEQSNAESPADEGLLFISRTGKTSDMTKIKGWRSKFTRNKETSPSNCDGSQKNLSAFCSNMLDEYLESEAQNISERAAAFSTNPEGSVAYQLPAKSSSYVKTLDSVLKHRNTASKFPARVNRPCPLSHKPLLYSALTSPTPPLASSATAVQAQAIQPSASSNTQPGAANAAPHKVSAHPAVSHRPAGFGHSLGLAHRPSGLTKIQYKLLQMEIGAQNEGLHRTQLTPDRLKVALSVTLTKEMLLSQVLKVAQYPRNKSQVPECGQDFCRLGCVCLSLQCLNRGPLHCRRPQCMFSCNCFKRKITKQLNSGESEQEDQPVYSMTYTEHPVQPRPGYHADKLWNRSVHEVDPDPVYSRESVPLCSVPVRVPKRSSMHRPTQPIREEDKDPVYKYLESMMTCARVREFNSKPPPEVTIERETSTPKPPEKSQEKTTEGQPKKYYRTLLTLKQAGERMSQGATSEEAEARKQIEIQSACQWGKDRKKVLEALCRRMNQNRLSQRFSIGSYRIRPVAKIFMRKPSGSLVTYRLHISKPSEANDNDECEFDDSDEEKHANRSFDGDTEPFEEDGPPEEPKIRFGVIPFLGGVLPAGQLRARTKPVGCEAQGLIQVNGKSYNQARLLLGNMGSLHPANRLAAYITGRLNAPADASHKNAPKSDPTNKVNTPGPLHIKAAGTVVPPTITARKTTELKPPTQPPVQLPQPDMHRKGSFTILQPTQNLSTINPLQMFLPAQRNPLQNNSTSSPVSLTVSPSLKTPSFLGQRGTYSFRICPPAKQSTKGQSLPGVALPGGFTLIQLPKPGADGPPQQLQTMTTPNVVGADKAPTLKDTFINTGLFTNPNANWFGVDFLAAAKELLSRKSAEPEGASELACNEKMAVDDNEDVDIQQMDSNLDITSEDLSSDSSDYCGEGDDDEEDVDIETVEEGKHRMAIANMREAVRRSSQESRDSSDDVGSAREHNTKDLTDRENIKDMRKRKNHLEVERQRRHEQRSLFDRLQKTLQTDPKAPRLQLLSLAHKEIQNLEETGRFLEEKKRSLTLIQNAYVQKLSFLSGKSEQLIRQKLKQVYDLQVMREKQMKWSPFFSHLLQSRAALLQDTPPEPNLHPTALSQGNACTPPSQASQHTTAAQSNVDHTPKPTPQSTQQSPAVASSVKTEVTTPSPQAENPTGEPVAPSQVRTSSSHIESQHQSPSVTAAPQGTATQEKASPTSPEPKSNSPSAPPPQPLTLPLVRSKTGRIILPSSLRPTGQGFFTLMVMKPKENGEDGVVTMQPSDADSSKNKEESSSKTDHPSDSEASHTLEEDKAVRPPDSESKSSGEKSPLAKLVLLNKSIYVPSVALKPLELSQEGVAGLGLNNGAACLSFDCVKKEISHTVKQEPDVSPSLVRRGRGRPRKNAIPPVGEKGKHTVEGDTTTKVSQISKIILAKGRPREKIPLASAEFPLGVGKESAGIVNDNPVPVKRGRGRPPKNNSVNLQSPPGMRAGGSPSNSKDDSPFILPRGVKFHDTTPKESPATPSIHGDRSSLRPLTRGALGKDFPSAKKRSWIDMEKELEPELESE